MSEILVEPGTSREGLTSAEAAHRLFAAGSSIIIGADLDAVIIGAIVALSVIVNLSHAYRSARALGELQSTIAPTVTAKRDGIWTEAPRADIVAGDLIRLSAGDLVPADCRLLESLHLHVQQSALTGESFPMEKSSLPEAPDRGGPASANHVFLGTSIVSG